MSTDTTKPATPAVYAAIAAVMAELSREGITKDRRNQQGSGYNFRGIDDVYNVLAPIMSRHQLMMLPRATERSQEERTTKAGGALFYTTVKMDFVLACAVDGSTHTITTYGEAMDSSDKSTNKAMSAAFKYAAFQAFCIPTEADNDADAHTPEPTAKNPPPPAGKPVAPTVQMATDEQKMDIAAYQLDTRTAAKAAEALAFFEKEHGVEVKTLKGLTFKMAEITIKKCEEAKTAAAAKDSATASDKPAAPAAAAGKTGGKK